jgi:hypothetical protein
MRNKIVRSGAVLALFGAFVACRGESQPATTTTTGAQVANEDAIQRIADARCNREEACNNIGSGKQYDNRDACTRELSHNARADLRPENCGALDPNRLDQCLKDIRDEKCGNPLDKVVRLASCRQHELCLQK